MFRKKDLGLRRWQWLWTEQILRQNLQIQWSAHNPLNLRKYGSTEIELNELCCSKIWPCVFFFFFLFYLWQQLSMKIIFFLLFGYLLNSLGKVQEREKQHKTKFFCIDWNFGQKSSIGIIHPFVILITTTTSVEEGADRVKFALLYSDA